MPTKAATQAIARSFLGVTENPPGSNRTRIGVEFGWNGVSWCAMTVSLELIKAGFNIKRNAGADELGAELLGYGWPRIAPANIVSGDVVVYTFSHIGLCEARTDSGHIIAFEGNHLDKFLRVPRANSSIRYGVRPPYSAAKLAAKKEAPPVKDTSWAIPLQDCGNNGDRPDRIVAAAKAAGNAALLVQVPRAPQGGAQARLARLAAIIHAYLYNAAARAGIDKLIP